MANEIQLSARNNQTYYVIGYAHTDVKVIQNNGLVTYNDANRADYCIALTPEGNSGRYVADMPAVEAGLYFFQAYRQLGASPDPDDMLVGTNTMHWDGTKEVMGFADTPLNGISLGEAIEVIASVVAGETNVTTDGNKIVEYKLPGTSNVKIAITYGPKSGERLDSDIQ